MAVVEFRYICTNCAMGWHDTPFCPFRRLEPRQGVTPAEMRTLRHLRQLEHQGVISDPFTPVFRWRWLFYGLLGLIGFLVLMILL